MMTTVQLEAEIPNRLSHAISALKNVLACMSMTTRTSPPLAIYLIYHVKFSDDRRKGDLLCVAEM
eukprot:3657579-Pleurochrysis_carterae.AAC.3